MGRELLCVINNILRVLAKPFGVPSSTRTERALAQEQGAL
jgi:hypothetical protein